MTSQRLSDVAAEVILGIAIFAAAITPGGDLVSPIVLGLTMYLLFEGTIVAIRRSGKWGPGATTGRRAADGAAGEGRSLPDAPQMEVVVVTGLSGGGKTAAAKLFEDLGYIVVDNLPGELLRDLADLIAADPARFARAAIVLDVRAGDVPLAFGAMRGALEGRGIRPR